MRYLVPLLFLIQLLLPIPCCQASDSLSEELRLLMLPAAPWILHGNQTDEQLDVAIIGAGMAGMAASAALKMEGISNVMLFDENPAGLEGPWIRYARMLTLRSAKTYTGPALGIPSLVFETWYRNVYGDAAWRRLGYIPTATWAEYLRWYREVLGLPVANGMRLESISPADEGFVLQFATADGEVRVLARKVVLATGRDGSGGFELPECAYGLKEKYYFHTSEPIDPPVFAGKKVVIIGCGAASFDAAATALENGAFEVDMLIRRAEIPQYSMFADYYYPGIVHGFYRMSDALRCHMFGEALEHGIPPPKSSVGRVSKFSNLNFFYSTSVESMVEEAGSVRVTTNRGELYADLIIFATGYCVDLTGRPELSHFVDAIALWGPHLTQEMAERMPKLGLFPYLGDHFQFLEDNPGSAPFLKHLYCFNYGASLSLGLISSDIPGINFGAQRLAQGIAADFFVEEAELYLEKMRAY